METDNSGSDDSGNSSDTQYDACGSEGLQSVDVEEPRKVIGDSLSSCNLRLHALSNFCMSVASVTNYLNVHIAILRLPNVLDPNIM